MAQALNMGAAWDDAMALLRQDRPLVATVAGALIFLPQLAFSWYMGDAVAQIAPTGDPQQMAQQLIALYKSILPALLVMVLLSIVANLAILHLWLGAAGTSVAAAFVNALRQVLTFILATLLLGLIGGIAGFVLLLPATFLPGVLALIYGLGLFVGLLYLSGRFAALLPVLVARGTSNPVTLITDSWRLTDGNGWRCIGFVLLIQIPAMIILMLVNMALSAVLGAMVSGFVQAVLSTILSVLMLAVAAAIYRQLAGAGREGVFT